MTKPITPEHIAVLGLYSMIPADRDRIACAIVTGEQGAHEWVYMSSSAIIFDFGFKDNPYQCLKEMGLSDLLLGNVATAREQGLNFLKFTAYFDDEEYEGYKSIPWEGQ